MLIALVVVRFVIWRRKRRKIDEILIGEPELWHVLLARMDEMLEHRGFVREMGETLLQFSKRMRDSDDDFFEQVAIWYQGYAASRYNPAIEVDVRSLEKKLTDLVSKESAAVSREE